MLFLLPIMLAAAPSVLAAATPGVSLFTRQVTPTADCVSACTPLEDATLAADGSVASLCTTAMINDYVQCYNCLITAGAITQSSAQTTVDGLASSCASAGFPVKDGTVSGGSSGSNTDTGSGTTLGSGSSSTAGAATSESTSTAGSSGSSSSSSSNGSAGSSSSGSSNSDSGSAASGDSSSSGSGLGSGSGFKTNDGLRLGAGPVSLLISLSALLMWT
ncbi:hypothetical protein DFH06DRAFT_1480713 [Mycena polygramma]|nr:hypothetical protein DFH06DRAFT_1480713 [Mycena polygramma]